MEPAAVPSVPAVCELVLLVAVLLVWALVASAPVMVGATEREPAPLQHWRRALPVRLTVV